MAARMAEATGLGAAPAEVVAAVRAAEFGGAQRSQVTSSLLIRYRRHSGCRDDENEVAGTATCRPTRQCMAVTVPATGAETCNSVFIASRITSVIPASTDWPTSFSIFQTLPWISA